MPELMDHQKAGVDWLRDQEHAALFDEPGLGKTAQLLLAATEPVLIVAPAMVLDGGVWDDEIEKFASGIEATQVSYSKMYQRGPNGKIIRDGNGFPKNPPREEYRRRWGTVIGDESHYLKGRKTGWTGAFQKLRADKINIATGTPIPNWAHEAFVSLQLMYPEEAKPGRRFGSYWRWAQDWFMVGPTLWSPMEVQTVDGYTAGPMPGKTWEEFNAQNWGDRMLLRLRKDCLDLPPLSFQDIRVGMVPAQARAYRDLKKDYVTWLSSGTEVAAWSSAGQVVQLAKCATGLEVISPEDKGSGKLEALRTLLVDRPLPTLVVAHFRSSVEACARSAEMAGKQAGVVHGGTSRPDRRELIRAFQRGNLEVLCASIDLISEGMTMTAADQVIRVERSMLPSKNEQVVRRLHRIGQVRPVTAIDLITRDTWDERVLALLLAKTDHQMRALGQSTLLKLA